MIEHLGHTELAVLGMTHLLPQRPAPGSEPCVEFDERAEALLTGIDPDPPSAVLHVLLDPTLLPTRCDVAWATKGPFGPWSGSNR